MKSHGLDYTGFDRVLIRKQRPVTHVARLINLHNPGIVSDMEMKHRLRLVLLIGWIISSTACNLLNLNNIGVTPQSTDLTATRTLEAPPYPTATEPVIQGTIRIWHSWNETERASLAQIIEAFKEIYPEVYFDVLYIPAEDIQARYATETQAGSGPTLLLGAAEWGPVLYDAGFIQNLEGVFPDSLLASLNKPALGAVQYKEALIGLPYSMQGVVLYRNKEITTLSPKTLDELATLAQTSTQGEDVGAVLERSFFYSGAHLNGIDGQWMDLNGMPTFDNERGIAFIELLRSFELAGPVNFLTDQDVEYFESGRVGWIIDGTWNLQNLVEAIGAENLAIDPWPTCEYGRLSGYVLPEVLYLSNRAEGDNLVAAKSFIEYFLSPQSQNNLSIVGRIPVISDIQLTSTDSSTLISEAMAALAGGVTYPVLPVMTIYNMNVDIALRAIFEEGVPPEEALRNAEEAILVAVRQSQATSSP
jgi:maltose-binding protein MalE